MRKGQKNLDNPKKTVKFETYDALDSVQETIEENLNSENSADTLEKLIEEDKEFEDLDIEEITEVTGNTQVKEEILPDISPFFTCICFHLNKALMS